MDNFSPAIAFFLFYLTILGSPASGESPREGVLDSIIDPIREVLPRFFCDPKTKIFGDKVELTFKPKEGKGHLYISIQVLPSLELAKREFKNKTLQPSGIFQPTQNYAGDEAIYSDYQKSASGLKYGGWIIYRKQSTIVSVYSISIPFSKIETISKLLQKHAASIGEEIEFEQKQTEESLKQSQRILEYYDVDLEGFRRMNNRDKVEYMLREVEVINAAVEQYAIETGKPKGTAITWSQISTYFRADSRIATKATDPLGNGYPKMLKIGDNIEINSKSRQSIKMELEEQIIKN